jgi:hypothetical protein
MASVDTPAEYQTAKSNGWRTFRTRLASFAKLSNEIICPASDEGGHRSDCERCKLCCGAQLNDRRKDILITVHGAGKVNYSLVQIAA